MSDEAGPSGAGAQLELEDEGPQDEASNQQRAATLREQNSKAQKRYRERQLSKRASIQRELEQLRQACADFPLQHQHTAALHAEVYKLEALVATHDVMLRDMAASPHGRPAFAAFKPRRGARMVSASPARPPVAERNITQLSSLQKTWLLQLNRLMTVVTGPTLDDITRQEVYDEGNQICATLESLQATDPLWMHSILISGLNVPSCFDTGESAAWRQVSNGLELRDDQLAALHKLREENMPPVDSLYVARRMLMHQMVTLSDGWRTLVASIAKPTTTVLQTADKLKFVQRLEAVGQNAMCLLDALRDNLVSEQQMILQVNTALVQGVLSQEQTIRFVMMVSPEKLQRLNVPPTVLAAATGLHPHPHTMHHENVHMPPQQMHAHQMQHVEPNMHMMQMPPQQMHDPQSHPPGYPASSCAAPHVRDLANFVRRAESAGNLQEQLQTVLSSLGLPAEAMPAALAQLAALSDPNAHVAMSATAGDARACP